MAQILASLDDINTHLPTDKIEADDAVTDLLQVDVARFMRGMLAGTFPATTLVTWNSPANTPEMIRGIAGKLIAAKYYAERVAEDSDTSEYAQNLYNEAIRMITDIRSGSLLVLDINDVPIALSGLAFSQDDFYPNATAPGPHFTLGKVFG